MDLEIVMKKLEDFFVGETHEALVSYKFQQRKQEPTENIETYVAALRQLAINCNIGQLRDRLIRNHVVVGVRDDCIREKLLSDMHSLSTSANKLVKLMKPLNNRQNLFPQALILTSKLTEWIKI